jgi:hypothetical protein
MKKLIAANLFLCLLWVCTFSVSAQTIISGPLSDKSVDPARLARIDTLVNDYINC